MTNDNSHCIEQDAVATLLYFDIFDHPLTVAETFAFLPHNSITVDDLDAAIAASGAIDRHAGSSVPLLMVHGRPAHWIDARLDKERRAARLWPMARIVGRLMACFPYVRGLFVSGSLSKNAPERGADIDWFIVTEPGRLWVSKTLLTLFRRTLLFNSTKFFCTNYYVSSDALAIPDRNVFIATEIATARPILSTELAGRFFSENSWIRGYFPNIQSPDTSLIIHAPVAAFIRRVAELPFDGRLGDWLENLFRGMHLRYERRAHPDVPAEDFALMFRAGEKECKIHQRNMQRHVIDAYAERLVRFGVTRKISDDPQ